jgi:hypothetical protein
MRGFETVDLVVNLAGRLANYPIVFGLRLAPQGSEPHGEWMRDQTRRVNRRKQTAWRAPARLHG